MAGTSLLALLDDIATMLDDISVMTKVAAKQTAGVLGDDLALNAEQVTGVRAERELPVVWAVAKGSLVNKAILVPLALGVSAIAPWAVTPLLMFGGAFLCFEGVEKLAHKHIDGAEAERAHAAELAEKLADPSVDLAALEKDKIKGAIRTDFILSAEIVTIALGTVAERPFVTQLLVLVGVAALMTAGVYGLVAGIVKLDDLGFFLRRLGTKSGSAWQLRLGAMLVRAAPWLMKFLSAAGTVAMFLVGGGILTHGVEAAHHWIDQVAESAQAVPGMGGVLEALLRGALNALAGVLAGAVALVVVSAVTKLSPKKA